MQKLWDLSSTQIQFHGMRLQLQSVYLLIPDIAATHNNFKTPPPSVTRSYFSSSIPVATISAYPCPQIGSAENWIVIAFKFSYTCCQSSENYSWTRTWETKSFTKRRRQHWRIGRGRWKVWYGRPGVRWKRRFDIQVWWLGRRRCCVLGHIGCTQCVTIGWETFWRERFGTSTGVDRK